MLSVITLRKVPSIFPLRGQKEFFHDTRSKNNVPGGSRTLDLQMTPEISAKYPYETDAITYYATETIS